MPTSALTVRRSRIERPEPSTIRTPASGTPLWDRTRRTTAAPPGDVPWPSRAPSCLRTSSAVKLSLHWSMKRRIFHSGGELTRAIGTAAADARPWRAWPLTVTPAEISAFRNIAAAATHLPGLASFAEHGGADPEGAAQHFERGEGDGQLLVGGRLEAEERVAPEQDLAGPEVDGECCALGGVDPGDRECAGELGRERALRRGTRAGRRGEQQRTDYQGDERCVTGHAAILVVGSDDHEFSASLRRRGGGGPEGQYFNTDPESTVSPVRGALGLVTYEDRPFGLYEIC